MTYSDDIARGEQLARSGKYAPARGKLLGRIELWCLDVYQGSPQPWIDALLAENDQEGRPC